MKSKVFIVCCRRTDAPPKDRQFLAWVNRASAPVICVYCDMEDAYTWAEHTVTPEGKLFFAQNGKYYVTCVGKASEIKGWMDLPTLLN